MGNRTRKRRAVARRKKSTDRSTVLWLVVGGVVVVLLGWAWLGQRSTPAGSVEAGDRAPAFTLTSAAGQQVSLADYADRNLLIYFSEGIGCDACLTQLADLEAVQDQFDELGVMMLGVMVNPRDAIARDAARFGIRTPILVDGSKAVSKAYDTLGRGMHADLPAHGFVLIDGQGTVLWRKDYPSMYVGPKELLEELSAALHPGATRPAA